jgi:hypothetical protein
VLKTLKDFISAQEPEVTTSFEEEVVVEPSVLSVMDRPNEQFWEEDVKQNLQHPMDPPAVLIMRRKSVRQFPNNQRVALYYVDKIDKYVTVPYTAMQWSSVTEETTLEQLEQIVECNESSNVLLEDGKKVSVTVESAESILSMYKVLNSKNRDMVLEMVKTKEQFNKVINFAKSYLK